MGAAQHGGSGGRVDEASPNSIPGERKVSLEDEKTESK
jgi:hypothetical protein